MSEKLQQPEKNQDILNDLHGLVSDRGVRPVTEEDLIVLRHLKERIDPSETEDLGGKPWNQAEQIYQIALLMSQDCKVPEISKILDMSERSVERKIKIIEAMGKEKPQNLN